MWAAAVYAAAFVGLAAVGAVRAFSPVPLSDAWDGYLNFFIRVSNGEWSAWWAQHNEHRLFWSRILFWIDLKWLGGTGWPLLVVIFAVMGLAALVFWSFLRDILGDDVHEPIAGVIGFFIVGMLFLWSQVENLAWSFETHFVLAQLIPLCAFYWLHRSTVDDGHSTRNFAVACCFGLAAIGAMANGVVVLPLMIAFALIMRQRAWRIGVLAALSVAELAVYFVGYQSIKGPGGSLLGSLKSNPIGMVKYVLVYLGDPFYQAARWWYFSYTAGLVIGAVAGLLLIGCSLWFAVRVLRQPRPSSARLGLLFFILYVGGTALGAAGGRLGFGWEQALASRYTTPTLMAWAALLVLFSPFIVARARLDRRVIWFFVAAVVAMVPLQYAALRSQETVLFQRKVAALALALDVNDPKQIEVVYPVPDRALAIAKVAVVRRLSVFGAPPLRGLGQAVGSHYATGTAAASEGRLETTTPVADPRYVRVTGWIYDPGRGESPRSVAIVSQDSRLVGYAFTGGSRPDLRGAFGKAAYRAGLAGYVLADEIGQPVFVVSDTGDSQFAAVVPR